MGSSRSVLAAGALLTTLAMGVLAGCGDSADAGTDGKLNVVASTNVWGSVAKAVGGADVTVTSLIGDAAADPHAYPDKPEDAVTVSEADLAISNGGGYDDFFGKLVDNTGQKRHIVAFDLSGKGEPEEPAADEHAEGEHEHGEVNEHVWYDLATVRTVADKIATELAAVDPEQASTFTANAKSFGEKLGGLETTEQRIGQAKPGAKVVATEPVAGYLLETAGLTDVTPPDFAEAIEEETDPPAAAVAETTELITGGQVAALVNNSQTETDITNAVVDAANGAGVPVVGVTETLPDGVSDYVEWMEKQIGALENALTGP